MSYDENDANSLIDIAMQIRCRTEYMNYESSVDALLRAILEISPENYDVILGTATNNLMKRIKI